MERMGGCNGFGFCADNIAPQPEAKLKETQKKFYVGFTSTKGMGTTVFCA